VWADPDVDLGGCSWHCGTPGPQGAAYYRCGINFNFARVHHLRCRPVAKAARLALRLPGEPNEPRSVHLAHVLDARFHSTRATHTHAPVGFSLRQLEARLAGTEASFKRGVCKYRFARARVSRARTFTMGSFLDDKFPVQGNVLESLTLIIRAILSLSLSLSTNRHGFRDCSNSNISDLVAARNGIR